jgi:hypothetical protein
MGNTGKLRLGKLTMELIWWVITAIVVTIVVRPLWKEFVRYDFIYELIMFIIIFITYTRYLFFIKFTFLAHSQIVKFILIFVSLPFLFYLWQVFFNYQSFLEKQTEGMIEFQIYFRSDITFKERFETLTYLSNNYKFFGWSSILAVFISPFRLLVSFWRVHNKTGRV